MLDCDLKGHDKFKNYIIQSNSDNTFQLQNCTSTWKVVFAMNCFTYSEIMGIPWPMAIEAFLSGVQSMSTRDYLCEGSCFGPKLCENVIIMAVNGT